MCTGMTKIFFVIHSQTDAQYMFDIQKMNKPIMLLLTLFCLNMGYCSLYKITSNGLNYEEGFTKQPKSLSSNSFKSACSLSEASTKISGSELERSSSTDLTIIALLTVIETLSYISIESVKVSRIHLHHIISPIPLFLKNRRIII